MLSHLRFHRRGPSNPTSPVPDQLNPWDHAEHPQTLDDVSPRPDFSPRSANFPALPPSLPPITRVTSAEADLTLARKDNDHHAPVQVQESVSSPPPSRPQNDPSGSGFMGGVALQNYRRAQQQQQQQQQQGPRPEQQPLSDAASSIYQPQPAPVRSPPPPINTNVLPGRPPPVPVLSVKPASAFMAPRDAQNISTTIGRRPAGTRLASEPVVPNPLQMTAEQQKGRKGLPFLKNPMSTLLMRRKAAQNAPDVTPLPLSQEVSEPLYDPRIRGTRVHDFSAPRQPRRVISNDQASGLGQRQDSGPDLYQWQGLSPEPEVAESFPSVGHRNKSNSSGRSAPPVPVDDLHQSAELGKKTSEQTLHEVRHNSFDQKPLPEEPPTAVPPVPPKDVHHTSSRGTSTTSRTISIAEAATPPRPTPSTRTARSRKISLSDASVKDGVISALPKHMKSTSSRFSFDMIGAAKQEKLLEERHRQRQLERGSAEPEPDPNRDSRYDEFDDDGFDYDAMMEDDGLEERIPGVNADYDDEEDMFEEEQTFEVDGDPDNDQENFAGFVFQRSNPQSSLASPNTPGMLITPRDATGKPIGFAMTKDTTPDLQPSASPTYQEDAILKSQLDDPISGLGIQGLQLSEDELFETIQDDDVLTEEDMQQPSATRDDELYFDGGLLEELNGADDEIQHGTFDESIFDAEDTDQYGRPIPGAFAQAQAVVAARAQEQQTKRESDMTSRLSAQSGMSQSTAHTSLSLGLQRFPSVVEVERDDSVPPKQDPPPLVAPHQLTSQDKIAAYQAALADAAHKAAASGKFRRDSSPPPPAELTITSPTTGSSEPNSGGNLHHDPVYDDYDDDDAANGMDDYDFDDDAIIAEANASALANDSDGFYGQEFGFYSAPVQQTHHGYGHGHHPSTSSTSSSTGNVNGDAPTLSAQAMFEYANGGYFGPSGINRSTSGRVVSREPNLTPITERSEYSNRNSIMSLTLPPAIGSDGRASASLHSPGLAQLAMMADDSDMSLSALMRLRNKAWGGSQASLSSSRDGSPRSERGGPAEGATSPWGSASAMGAGAHGRKNSAFSIWSKDSDVASGSGSPTLTMNTAFPAIPASDSSSSAGAASMQQPMFSPPPPPIPQPSPGPQCPPVFEDEEVPEDTGLPGHSLSNSGVWMKSPAETHAGVVSPISPSTSAPARRPGMGHRHKGSADSISYTKEEDSGETRWVIERRRREETGEVKILGRQVVEGGRI